jgi:hypothetical protein
MIGAAANAEAIVAREARRLRLDAEAILTTVARPDYPNGVAVIEPANRSRDAFSLGSGHRLAEALGCRRRPAAVVVGCEARLRDALAYHGVGDVPKALAAAQADVEATALHEAAHALVAEPDELATEIGLDAYQREYEKPSRPDSPARQIATHQPAWAVAYAVLAGRAIQFRPRGRDALTVEVRGDFADYVIDYARLADLTASVPFATAVRELLTDVAFMELVRDAIPADATRVAVAADKLAQPGVPAGREGFWHEVFR